MSIEIRIKKEVTMGEKFCKIVSIKALRKEELPKRYTEMKGSVYLTTYKNGGEWLWVKDSTGASLLTKKWDWISPERMEEVLSTCKKAGLLLRKIYLELEVENEGWEGEETYII